MTKLANDPLLSGTRVLLAICKVFAMFFAGACAVALPTIWFFRDKILAELKVNGQPVSADGLEPIFAISAMIIGAFVLATLGIVFLRKLIAFIDSLKQGSPFIQANADRLRSMGWLALAIQGLALIAVPITVWLSRVFPDGKRSLDFHLSLEGLIVALLLLILARVFEHGTRLAEDVEGTV